MRKSVTFFLFGFFSVLTLAAQQTVVKGSVIDGTTLARIPNVTITIEETLQSVETDAEGQFSFTADLPLGDHILKVEKSGYLTKRFPIIIYEGQTLDISDMMLDINIADTVDLFTITLSDDELNDDAIGGADNISGLLQSSQDIFQRTAAFEFSASFFSIRGLSSENSTILINGIEMNKVYNGRPQWSNWGGLNDVLRNQELSSNLTPSNYTFGGILGSTNINTRASEYKKGGRLTYSSSDRSYTNRAIGSYATGLMKGDWAVALSVGKRWGDEGFQEATFYDSNSFFASVEKIINDKQSLNFTAIYTPNRRGKSSPNTQEVYDLKGITYNEYWGYQDGEKRNSRVKEVNEPIIMLNHYWDITNTTTLNTNVAYQFGKTGNSRLDYPGGGNPNSAYYQKLPSYALANSNGPDYATAYQLEQEFLKDGQIDWNRIYDAILTKHSSGATAAYLLYEDRNDDSQITANTVLISDITDHITLNGALNYTRLKSDNFAEVIDLLGATGALNMDAFDNIQYDLKNPNRIVSEGDRFRYNYILEANVISGFAQAQFKYTQWEFFAALSAAHTAYLRDGIYQHEIYPDNSYGKGEKLNFIGVGAKAGLTYKITGKHVLNFNVGYLTKAPSLRNTYSNSRENQNVVKNISEEKITSADVSYIFRSSIVKAKLTGYFSKIEDANEISFYYADGLSSFEISENQTSAFVQEILQGIDKQHFGAELGLEAQLTTTIKIKGAGSVGQFTYSNNPNLYLTSSSFTNPSGIDYGKALLKNYKLAGGPQTAYSAGFEYRDPEYWWFGATANFFENTYVDISPLIRTRNFYSDADGLPFNDYDAEVARKLLKQERFDDYMIVNLVGGKSWKIKQYYLGFFASINNLLDTVHKTGGFEQGRNANYRELKEDVGRDTPVFGSKYWYGRGATYFLNVYVRF
ncbi:carboxypeptidase regulatory-like domain-containing protein [Gelidibacter salicanalis]|uniref:Carboxypeptidase-like regulatory domain-containing protein n=1 Tax=Gelidibacter salicanalis TaxID=291193 RepID=A0A934KU24_9FLAO|nr:carboxypeptidase regulatory-like domain-containing protein [Gelidibacter salicanalis]MBJ7879445.1 carboxypeptidase-like regulatory domain-containing protein [Gelidibacter salicanalis]